MSNILIKYWRYIYNEILNDFVPYTGRKIIEPEGKRITIRNNELKKYK